MDEARLRELVEQARGDRGEDECWPWPLFVSKRGYGWGRWEGKPQGMHRVTLEVIGGIDIPEGWHAGHLCHDRDASCPGGPCPHRACVNWLRHLEPMTPLANYRAGRALRRERCPSGHLLSGDNLWISHTKRDGPVRRCRECTIRQNEAARQKRLAARA